MGSQEATQFFKKSTLTMNFLEKKIKKSMPFIIASKTTEFLEINLTKEVRDLYSENHKTLRK